MTSGPLEAVLAAERELSERLGSERLSAANWLEQRKRELDEAARAELLRLDQEARERQDAAERAATNKASALLEKARSAAAELGALDDARLLPLVRKHIARILPGAAP